jgi:hypothetical protein
MKENTPMKTNAELETLIQNLIERMNRVEANVANQQAELPEPHDPLVAAIDDALQVIDRGIDDLRDRLDQPAIEQGGILLAVRMALRGN